MTDYLESLEKRENEASELKIAQIQSASAAPADQTKLVSESKQKFMPVGKKAAPQTVSPINKLKSKKVFEFAGADKTTENLELVPMAYTHDQLQQKFDEFYSKLPHGVLKSNHHAEYVLEKMREGYHGHYLFLVEPGTTLVYGMACLNYDQSVAGSFRAYIRQLSTINAACMPLALEKTVEYIWKHMPCEHVRVELLHIKDEETGKTAADVDVKTCFTSKGFRWKTLTNDPTTGRRA